jgi:hypothetical protein
MSEPVKKLDVTAAQRVARRRSIAIALMLGAMVLVFYAATLVKFGGALSGKAL